jgi:hypothetical protein
LEAPFPEWERGEDTDSGAVAWVCPTAPFLTSVTMNQLLRIVFLCLLGGSAYSQSLILTDRLHHLRNGSEPQWEEFSGTSEGDRLRLNFKMESGSREHCLALRQYNVNEAWKVLLNNQVLGELTLDEKDMLSYFSISKGLLRSGENTIEILPAVPGTTEGRGNDIRVGQISLIVHSLEKILHQASVEIEVREGNALLPCRITVTDAAGTLHPIGQYTTSEQAVRTGFLYTATGKARFGLPAGDYILYANRGTEYGVDSVRISLKAGDHIEKKLFINHEVFTPGWVSSDTHIHTFTHSRHGDATNEERVLTLAGEGLELPIITDHNVLVNLLPTATKLGLNAYFTLVPGMELTTPIGHFNVFPVNLNQPPPNHRVNSWDEIKGSPQYNIILNHARDLHGNFRPFDERHHIAPAGQSLLGWKFPANSMEVINSGATQSDPMQLFRDWFGLLNRGLRVAPVGASDSHTVSRYLVGQARTYIRCGDEDPGRIDVSEAMDSFRQGKVMVSYGLVTELTVEDAYGPGELAKTTGNTAKVTIRISGPSWTRASRVSLYANGALIRQETIALSNQPGLKWEESWMIKVPRHDVFLVAIAEGPNDRLPFWQFARPYQPTSGVWAPGVMGASGSVFLDADRDGKWSGAWEYAQRLTEQAGDNSRTLLKNLSRYDEAVAIQVGSILRQKFGSVGNFVSSGLMKRAAAPTRSGLRLYEQELAKINN